MSFSAQLTSAQLKEIIEDEKNTDKSAREVQEQVEDGEEVLIPENTSSVLNPVYNTINNEFESECYDDAVRLLNVRPIRQSPADCVPGCKTSIQGLSGTMFLAYQVWAIGFIVRSWVWDADMPGALAADEMGLGKTFTAVATAMLCKLVTEKVVMGLPLSILWGNTLEQWVIVAHNDFPGIISEEQEWYPLQRSSSVPCCLVSAMVLGYPAAVRVWNRTGSSSAGCYP